MCEQVQPPPTVQIDVSAGELPEPHVRVSVIDNGPGLTQEVQQRLSQPFFTTKDAEIGLGLTIVREALARMSAVLELANEPTGGARFSIRLRPNESAGPAATNLPSH
jgi:signal transduction histidine kinase